MYITHPSAPAGTIMSDTFIQNDLIPFLRANRIWLISDSYISSTRFDGKPLRPILSFPGAKDVAVEAITVSKEIGLPGARAGGVAGNEKIIEALRIHAATTIDTIALPSQRLAAKALREIDPAIAGSRIAQELHEKVLPRFSAMNWPVLKPAAGIDMLVSVPPGFIRAGIEDPGLLASVSILRRFGVAFFPCSVFDQEGNGKFFLRLVLKQKEGKIPNALDLLRLNGFDFEADKPIAEDIDFLRHKIDTLDLIKL
jgi:aspartate/methionine/tyrosine aminotransferase